MRMNPWHLLLLLPLVFWSSPGAAQSDKEKEKEKARVQAHSSIRVVQAVKPTSTAKPVKPATAATLNLREDIRLQPRAIGRNEVFEREIGVRGGVRFEQLQSMRQRAERAAGMRVRAVTTLAVEPQNERNYERHPIDCDDGERGINPGQGEICNFKDDDCDTDVDEGVAWTVWQDRDGDGYGDPGRPVLTCPVGEALADVSMNNRDCDDGDYARNPSRGNCP